MWGGACVGFLQACLTGSRLETMQEDSARIISVDREEDVLPSAVASPGREGGLLPIAIHAFSALHNPSRKTCNVNRFLGGPAEAVESSRSLEAEGAVENNRSRRNQIIFSSVGQHGASIVRTGSTSHLDEEEVSGATALFFVRRRSAFHKRTLVSVFPFTSCGICKYQASLIPAHCLQ